MDSPQPTTEAARESARGDKKVLVLGSGFGGTYALRYLARHIRPSDGIAITMVSDENFFLFAPLLHEVAMGSVETRHIAYPIRQLPCSNRFDFVQATVEKIDLKGRKVTTTAGSLDFDYLIMALGCVNDTSELGVAVGKKGAVFTLKTLYDSILLRNHIIGIFEEASSERDEARRKKLLTFVVSGRGYLAVQVVTALRDLVFKTLLRLYPRIGRDDIRIVLLEPVGKLIPHLHPRMGIYVAGHLDRAGIEVRLRSRISGVTKNGVEVDGSASIPTSTLIWVDGLVANPRIAELAARTDKIGRVIVNEYLEVPGVPGVAAVGDCAHFKGQRNGEPIPPRAHTGVRQAKIAAYNILAAVRGKQKRPYRYSNPFGMATLGTDKAIFSVNSLRIYGFPARFIWLAGYSLLVMGMYNRIRIVSDWLLSLVFGRDTTLLKRMR